MGYKNLVKPIKVRGLELKNRVIFPAIRTKLAEKDGSINQELIDYHVRRARGGVGLSILEGADVYEYSSADNQLSITSDEYIDDLKKLVDEVHKVDGKIGIQLWTGWAPKSEEQNLDRLFPSEYKLSSGKTLEAIESQYIEEIIEAYGQGARRANEAGFDAIDINAAFGNTLHGFLSPAFNKREDEYGGSLENRSRLLIEVIEEVRKNINEDLPIILTIVSKDDYLDGGLEIEDIIAIASMAEEAGVDILNITRGNLQTDAKKYTIPPVDIKRGFNVENTAKIKEGTNLLVTSMGRINEPSQAEEILSEGKADFIGIARGILADPDFLNKVKDGMEDKIINCIGCNQGCYTGLIDKIMPHITCARNPMVCRERSYALIETEEPQKVAIVGGGVGGMSAALILNARGHEAILFEETDRLGGQIRLAGKIPGKEEFKKGMNARIDEINNSDIEVRMETEFIDEMVVKENFDSVIIATGAEPKGLDIKGNKLDNVHIFSEILRDDLELEGDIVIIGGGFAGLGLAELLANIDGNRVTVFEEKSKVGEDLGELRRISTLENLEKLGVSFKTSVETLEIKEDRVIYKKGKKKKELKMDHLVMAVGYSANKSNDIKQYCQDREIPFYVIGDALIPRRAMDAISEAANISINEIK